MVMTSRAHSNDGKFRGRLTSVALVAALATAISGCKTTTEPAASLAMASARNDTDWRSLATEWGERHRATPNDPVVAINYAQALRGIGQRSQAAAVLEQASIRNPKNME